MKKIYTGIESSGKSLQLAREAYDVMNRNSKWYDITGKHRPIVTNTPFSSSFIELCRSKNVPIEEWHDLEEIIYREECDVFIDEIIKYFDARLWANLSLDTKHWLTQGAKSGIHVYGAAQDFSQVDKSFRLLCNEVFQVSKVMGSPRPMKTRPPIKRIWGICMLRRVSPTSFKGDTASMETIGMPSFFLIDKKDCEIFDTSVKIKPSKPAPLKKIVRVCPEDGHKITRYV